MRAVWVDGGGGGDCERGVIETCQVSVRTIAQSGYPRIQVSLIEINPVKTWQVWA